jgi:hypothetical protein
MFKASSYLINNFFIDEWGFSCEAGDDVVACTYYQKWGTIDSSYVLLETF